MWLQHTVKLIVLHPYDTVLKATLSRLMHICYTAMAEIEGCSWRNILLRDKLTNTNRFINRSVLDNRVSLFRVHFTVSYSQIYCGYRFTQAFHIGIPRAYATVIY